MGYITHVLKIEGPSAHAAQAAVKAEGMKPVAGDLGRLIQAAEKAGGTNASPG